MRAIIHGTTIDGDEDYIVLSGTEEEIREQAAIEVKKRGWTDPWSEIISE